jgi:hypothetical protein
MMFWRGVLGVEVAQFVLYAADFCLHSAGCEVGDFAFDCFYVALYYRGFGWVGYVIQV